MRLEYAQDNVIDTYYANMLHFGDGRGGDRDAMFGVGDCGGTKFTPIRSIGEGDTALSEHELDRHDAGLLLTALAHRAAQKETR